MPSNIKYLHQLLQRGYCCSSALTAVGLRHKGSENQQLLDAMKGLCNGLGSGLLCGALSGAACLMCLLEPQSAANGALEELTEWFEAEYCQKYGSLNCRDILGAAPINRSIICPQIIEETYKQACQLLCEHGFIFEEDDN